MSMSAVLSSLSVCVGDEGSYFFQLGGMYSSILKTSSAFLALYLNLKLYPLAEKLLIVEDPDATIVLLLLLLRIRWLGRGIHFIRLLCMLPDVAGGPVQLGGEVEGGGVGASDDVGSAVLAECG